MKNSNSGDAERDTRPFFYLSHQYFDLFPILGLSNRGIRTHIELMCRYTNHDGPGHLTREDLRDMPTRAVRDLKKSGLLFEEGPRQYHLATHADGFEIFRHGPRKVARKAIPASIREYVYERDGRACLHCGSTESLSLDHIHPWSLGGTDDADNLQTLCRPCNSRKGARIDA